MPSIHQGSLPPIYPEPLHLSTLALLQPMEQLLQQVRGAAHSAAAAAARGLKAAEGAARGLWAKLTAGKQRQPLSQEL